MSQGFISLDRRGNKQTKKQTNEAVAAMSAPQKKLAFDFLKWIKDPVRWDGLQRAVIHKEGHLYRVEFEDHLRHISYPFGERDPRVEDEW